MNVEKYSQHSYNARYNAQHNLCGRSHFVDEHTLRYFKGRVLSAYDRADGRLFVVVHSQATSFNDFTRVYSYAIFDLAGNVIAGQAQHYKSAATARKHCADMLALLDADQLTLDALSYLEGRFANDISYARQKWTPALEDAA
jgi:hypothetical protein|tara:strand:- start:1623 stop:2048 length:426 start_codon:yes stop_codon:yes gene_type:complete